MTAADVLVLGADSLVGSHFVAATSRVLDAAGRRDPREELSHLVDFSAVDLTDPAAVDRLLERTTARAIVNFAAATDVDALERERPPPASSPNGAGWALNAELPARLGRWASQDERGVISLSTDFVFDGRSGPYGEGDPPTDAPASVSWYGWTKREGERRLREAAPHATIVRISYPFRARFREKLDFARWVLDRGRSRSLPPLYTDQRVTPTWIPDVSRTVERLLDRPTPGVIHVASPTSTTPFEFGRTLLSAAGISAPIQEGRLADRLRATASTPRPLRGGLSCARLGELGLTATPWAAGIESLVRGDER